MKLKAEKPLAFFDTETTGVDLGKDKIISLAIVIIDFERNKMKKKYYIFNPMIPISKEASEINGFYNENVEDKPPFKVCAEDILEIMQNCIPVGYNINTFDIPILKREFIEAGLDVSFMNEPTFKTLDVFRIVKKLYQRSLSDMYKRYTGKDLEDSHDALADTMAVYELLANMLKKEELPDNLDDMIKFYYDEKFDSIKRADVAGKLIFNEEGKIVYNFGKNKGMLVSDDTIKDYAEWIVSSPDKFSEEVIQIIKKEASL